MTRRPRSCRRDHALGHPGQRQPARRAVRGGCRRGAAPLRIQRQTLRRSQDVIVVLNICSALRVMGSKQLHRQAAQNQAAHVTSNEKQ